MKMNQHALSFDRVFPLMGMKDGVLFSRRGDITLGWELTLPDAFSIPESEYDEMVSSLASAFRILPPWMMVHRQDVYTYDNYVPGHGRGFLEESFEHHFKGRRFMTHRQFLFLTLTSKASIMRPVSSSGLLTLGKDAPLPSAAQARMLESKSEEFVSVLTGSGKISARRLSDDDFATYDNEGIIPDYLTLGGRGHMLSDFPMSADHVEIGDRHLWAYTVSESDDLPTEIASACRAETLSSVSSELFLSGAAAIGLLLKTPHIVNQYILTIPQTEALSELDSRMRRMTSMSRSADNRIGAEEIGGFIDEVHTESLSCVRAHTNILAWGAADCRQEIRGRISSALAGMGITCVEDTYDTPVLWYSGIPGAACEIGWENLMLMELRSALCLGIWETYGRDIKDGMLRICDRIRNIPVTIDVQRKAQDLGLIDNYNAFVLGGSGTGKSFFTNFFVRNCYDSGETVFIIDVGDSYEGLCSVIREESGGRDGHYHSWDNNHPLTFNAFIGFHEWMDERGRLRQDSNGLNFLLSFIQTLWAPPGGWSADMTAILKQMIWDFIRSRERDSGMPVFDDLRRFILTDVAPRMEDGEGYECGDIRVDKSRFDVDSLLLAMKDYAREGAFGFLLNDPNPPDLFTSRFTVFEIDRLSTVNDPKFYSLCVLCIMNSFDAKMRSTGGFKVMIIEEAWKAISNETMAPYLAGLWKTARKFMTSAVVVTQQITDIMSSPVIRDTILQNSSVRILLDQSNNQSNFNELGTLLGLNDRQRNLILSMNRDNDPAYRYREVFIALGEKMSGVYATEVSPQEAVAFESSKEKKKEFLRLSASKGAIEAIKEITGLKQ